MGNRDQNVMPYEVGKNPCGERNLIMRGLRTIPLKVEQKDIWDEILDMFEWYCASPKLETGNP